MGEHEQVVRGSDLVLAGLPRDRDYCVSHHHSTPLPSPAPLPSFPLGASSGKSLGCVTHWPSQPEIPGPAASEHLGRRLDLESETGPGPQSHGTSSCSNLDLHKGRCKDQDLLKRHYNIAKKSSDASSSKGKLKSTIVVPDSQKVLRCELESLKSQLQAQTKAFEFLNHSVTMLEKESCLQQIKMQHLEEVLNPTGRQGEKEGCRGTDQGRQELYGALAQGLQGLQKTLREGEEVQRARTTRCLQLLAQEIRDSKKFLWEELELVREEVTFIYQKLQAQEDEISENLLNIQKMQQTQVKCRKVLTKMKQQGYEPSSWPDTSEAPEEGSGCWKGDLRKELSDIWSAVHRLQNSIDCLAMSTGAPPRASSLRGHKGHRCLSPPHPAWDSDSDCEPPFSKTLRLPS
uniref:Coiled-coil domain containing 159 n=1 Tax=Jaculus jaculus TaxID=51337 RepID=A0A8C5JX82_JACJA